MRFLPIVERELRVAARRPRTYWVRLAIAFAGIVIGAVMLGAYSLTGQSQAVIGKTLFQALSGLAFIYCLFAGRLATADSISSEKRDGTLGLLFLTDLKGYDIVIGKMVATALNSFYGLLAILPVLGLPLLLGGMTNGEFGRTVLVLLNLFLLSLAIGIFASAASREARAAYGGNLLLTLAVVVILPGLGAFLLAELFVQPVQPAHFVASPLFALYAVEESVFGAAPRAFGGALLVMQAWIWLLVTLASWMVPRTWQDLPAVPQTRRWNWRGFWRRLGYGRPEQLKAFRKRLLDINGYYWLTARARLKPLHVWLLLLAAAGWWFTGWYLNEGGVWLDPSTGIALAVILNAAFKMWVAIEAGQQLAEDRRAGTLELILSTPLTVPDIVKGQLLALRRQFLLPLLVVIIIEAGFMVAALRDNPEPLTRYLWLAGMTMLVADLAALVFVAMASALTTRTPQQMILKTFFRVLVLPWIAFAVISLLANLWVALGSDGGEPLSRLFNLGLWFALGLAADLAFGIHAALVVFTQFRRLAADRFDAETSTAAARTWRLFRRRPALNAASHAAEAPATRPRGRWTWLRRPAVRWSLSLVLLSSTGWFIYRWLNPSPPAAVVVHLPAGSALEDLRITAGNTGFLFVLPDDSLWQWGVGRPARDSRPRVPRPLDQQQRWRMARSSVDAIYGLREDGTLWAAGLRRDGAAGRWTQVGSADDWNAIFIGQSHHAALKRDGSLWMWGDNHFQQLGVATRTPRQPEPVQVGTNTNWQSAYCWARCTVALQSGGSLWFWGEPPHVFRNRNAPRAVVREPARYSRDDIWTAVAFHWTPYARDTNGTWRVLFDDLPGPATAADDNTRAFLARAETESPVFGFLPGDGPGAAAYEVRPDGSLKVSPFAPPFSRQISPVVETWQPYDLRRDWVRVWSNGGTMLGLTADGTLWTWGIDLGADGDRTLRARWIRLQAVLNSMLGRNPGGRTGAGPMYAIQHQPRPLMKLVPEP